MFVLCFLQDLVFVSSIYACIGRKGRRFQLCHHRLGNDVAGYVRVVNKFVQAVVRGAGHILPFDQPERALDLIQKFVNME